MNFARQLRLAMDGMTQEELSTLSGVPQSSIARYLSGARSPGYESLMALQVALPHMRASAPKAKARRVSTTSRSKTKG